MNNINILIKNQKNLEKELKEKKIEQYKIEDTLEEQRQRKNNIFQAQRKIKNQEQILKAPFLPQIKNNDTNKTIFYIAFIIKLCILGILSYLLINKVLLLFISLSNIANIILTTTVFISLTLANLKITSKRYKKKIKNNLFKKFGTTDIYYIKKELESELDRIIDRQKKLNQQKYRLESETENLQKELHCNKEKMYQQVIEPSSKQLYDSNKTFGKTKTLTKK